MIEWSIREALKGPGCPLCSVVREAHDTFYRWFVIETYGKVPLLEDLSQGGVCEYHAWETARVTGRRLSVTYEFLVASEHEKLQRVLSAGRKGFGPPCYFSKEGKDGGRKRTLGAGKAKSVAPGLAPEAGLLSEETGRELFIASDGLCLPHLNLTLREAEPEIAVFLVTDALKRLDVLRAGFEEYFRKEDYRYAHEPKGAEQQTWLQAVERFAGRSRVPDGLAATPESPDTKGRA